MIKQGENLHLLKQVFLYSEHKLTHGQKEKSKGVQCKVKSPEQLTSISESENGL